MTNHVEHTNNLIAELKRQYTSQIEYLRAKISEQQNEINRLNRMLDVLIYKSEV